MCIKHCSHQVTFQPDRIVCSGHIREHGRLVGTNLTAALRRHGDKPSNWITHYKKAPFERTGAAVESRPCQGSMHCEQGAGCRATTCCHPAREKCLLLWLLKNSLAEIGLENRRARMPYKRLSRTRYTYLVTNFGSIFRKTFSTPTLDIPLYETFPWEGDVGGQEMASPQRRTSR